jgi:uncharacterized protein YoxC
VRLAPLACLLAVAVLLAGCGSKKSQPPTTAQWADGVCTAVNTWTTSIKSSISLVTSGNISKSSIQNAGKEMESATETLESDLKGLGKPNTPSGQKEQASIDQLSSDLKTDIDSIKTTLNGVSSISSAVSAASTATSTLATMKTQITSTYTQLKQGDVSGELKTAFAQSSSCSKLTSNVSSISP